MPRDPLTAVPYALSSAPVTTSTSQRVTTISLLIETLRREQDGPLRCRETEQAITYLSHAKACLITRATRRLIEGKTADEAESGYV